MALLQGTRGSSEGQGLAAPKAHKEGQDGRRKMADSLILSPWMWAPPCHTRPLPRRIQLLETQLPPLLPWPSPCAGWRHCSTHTVAPITPFLPGLPATTSTATAPAPAPTRSTRCWGDGVSPAGCSPTEVLGGDGFCSSRSGLHPTFLFEITRQNEVFSVLQFFFLR